MITLAALVLASLAQAAPSPAAVGQRACTPQSDATRVVMDFRFDNVTLDRFMATYFSESFNAAAAPLMGLKSRRVVEDKAAENGNRQRRVRMQPAMSVPGPLKVFGSDEQLRYDELVSYDAAKHALTFFIESAACDQVKYGGTMRFTEDGDGVRMQVDARLNVNAPLGLNGLVEGLVKGGVSDGYSRFATFMQAYLDERRPVIFAAVTP